MKEFEIKDAIDLLYKQTTVINSLWTVYVAATFAAGGFSALTENLVTRTWIAAALTIAFGAFTFGHWRMLRPELAARWKLSQEVKAALSSGQPTSKPPYAESIGLAAEAASPPYKGGLVHISIDTCVMAAIWLRVFSE